MEITKSEMKAFRTNFRKYLEEDVRDKKISLLKAKKFAEDFDREIEANNLSFPDSFTYIKSIGERYGIYQALETSWSESITETKENFIKQEVFPLIEKGSLGRALRLLHALLWR